MAQLTSVDAQRVALRPLRPGDGGWVIQRHAELYAAEEGFDSTFEPLVARIVAEFLDHHDPDRERGWIAEADGGRLGCIFCVDAGHETAKLRLFLLEPAARGLGLGRRLLDACTGFARDAGYSRMALWTHAEHEAACALYARAGFVLDNETPVTSFGRALTEQSWSITF